MIGVSVATLGGNKGAGHRTDQLWPCCESRRTIRKQSRQPFTANEGRHNIAVRQTAAGAIVSGR
jgi:hypothetical protein